ncbi:putative reverse transcriptase domain-containing protein [Tanacetum coccineum]
MPPKLMSQAAIQRLITERVNAAIKAERERHKLQGRKGGNVLMKRGARWGASCSRVYLCWIMKCNPTVFHGHEGAFELNLNEAVRMAHALMEQKAQARIERIVEGNKRKWESSQGGNNGNNRNNNRDNTRHNQQNNQRKHHFGYCNVVCNNYGKAGHMARDCKGKAIATGANARPTVTCYDCGEKGHTRNYCPKRKDPQGKEARGRAYVIKDTEKQQGPNVVTDFPEVFPDDLPGHPPPRKWNCKLKLDRVTTPVARAPYDWHHPKTKELADQIARVRQKRFIAPELHRHGESTMLFVRIGIHFPRIDDLFDQLKVQRELKDQSASVPDALVRKDREPIRVRSLVMTVHTNLPERILNAQTDAMKEENVKAENLGRLIKPIFETRSDGIQCFEGRIWFQMFRGLQGIDQA